MHLMAKARGRLNFLNCLFISQMFLRPIIVSSKSIHKEYAVNKKIKKGFH